MAILGYHTDGGEVGAIPNLAVDIGDVVSTEQDVRVWAERAVDAVEDSKIAIGALCDLAIDVLRLMSALEPLRMVDLPEVRALAGKVSYVTESLPKTLQRAGVHVADLAGLPYTAGLDVDVLNLADFEPSDSLVIDVIVEPLLLYTPRLAAYSPESQAMTIRPGRVTVKKLEGL